MLLQELPENQSNQQQISTLYAIFLLVLYWALNLGGQALVFIPQMMQQMLEMGEGILEADPLELTNQLLGNIHYSWLVNVAQLAVFGLVLWLFKRKNVSFFTKQPFTKKELLTIILYGVALVAVSMAFESVIDAFYSDFNTANQVSIEKIFNNSSRLTMFISLVILAPITEEVMFRGVFSVIFKKAKGVGMLVCAVVFALFHGPTDLLSFLVYFVMAAGLGLIYWKTERLEASIFAHMLNNLIGFILMMS